VIQALESAGADLAGRAPLGEHARQLRLAQLGERVVVPASEANTKERGWRKGTARPCEAHVRPRRPRGGFGGSPPDSPLVTRFCCRWPVARLCASPPCNPLSCKRPFRLASHFFARAPPVTRSAANGPFGRPRTSLREPPLYPLGCKRPVRSTSHCFALAPLARTGGAGAAAWRS
jgi:hypothetical protein